MTLIQELNERISASFKRDEEINEARLVLREEQRLLGIERDQLFLALRALVPAEVSEEDEQDAAGEIISGEPFPMSAADTERSEMTMVLLRGETEIQQPATPIPEGFTKWEGAGYEDAPHCKDVEVLFRDGRILQGVSGEFTWSSAQQLLDAGWKHSDAEGGKIDPADDIIAYRIIETGAPPSELDSSQIEGDDRVENLHDQPKLTDQQYDSLEPLPADKPSTVFLDQAEAAINDRIEDEPSEAAVFAHGLNIEIDQKAEPKPKFGGIFGFGGKKTLVGEGV